tara:strand:+ start:127 stop:255 length:129 start_codon:yes stop_codon:yes gene_type:complete
MPQRAVQAAKRAFQALDIGQQHILANLDAFHDNLAGEACAQR